MRQFWMPIVMLMLITACSMSSNEPITQTYRLTPELTPMVQPVEAHLKVARPEVSPELNGGRIVLHIEPHRMDHYAAASWPDNLPDYLLAVLVHQLGRAGLVRSTGRGSQSGTPNYKLVLRVLDFQPVYQKTTQGIPEIVMAMELTLLRSRGQTPVFHEHFRYRSPATGERMSDIIQGLNTAFETLLQEMLPEMNQAMLKDLSQQP